MSEKCECYIQGYKDGYKDHIQDHELIRADAYQQGRADAIKEFVTRHNNCNTNLCDKVGKGISCCECIAEQMKESNK